MNTKYAAIIIIASLLVAAVVIKSVLINDPPKGEYAGVYIGIDVAYDSIQEIKTTVDSASSYTNLFIIGSTGVTHNETKLNDICQYIYDKDLSFIVYTEMTETGPQISSAWVEHAKALWGSRFLGIYLHDEPGGKQLDLFTVEGENGTEKRYPVKAAENWTDAKNQFVTIINMTNEWMLGNITNAKDVKIFTSDYALYWFDYEGGYDTVFAEFTGNYSKQLRQLIIALVRGAATAQNKDWGVMITRKYTEPPYYLGTGEELYADMVLAYQNGAKYIIIFDSNENYTHGILREEHFQALKEFADYAHKNPRTENDANNRMAYILPPDFGYGFRGPDDKIWGLWSADAFSREVATRLANLLKLYDARLDVIYDDALFPVRSMPYSRMFFWNGTIIG